MKDLLNLLIYSGGNSHAIHWQEARLRFLILSAKMGGHRIILPKDSWIEVCFSYFNSADGKMFRGCEDPVIDCKFFDSPQAIGLVRPRRGGKFILHVNKHGINIAFSVQYVDQ